MRHSVVSERLFPLTLTLSLGEREKPPTDTCFAHAGLANSVAAMARKVRTILPLPWREGRGEGIENVAHPTLPGVRASEPVPANAASRSSTRRLILVSTADATE